MSKLGTFFVSPLPLPFFGSILLHASGVWNLVRDYGLQKGQVPMYDNSQSIEKFIYIACYNSICSLTVCEVDWTGIIMPILQKRKGIFREAK